MSLDVQLTYEIPIPRDLAFELFTEHFAHWWPASLTHTGHSVAMRGLPRQVGQPVEMDLDGVVDAMGDVTHVDPSGVIEWRSWFRQRRENATRIRVRFVDVEYGTRMIFQHFGWDERNAAQRERFNDWPVILWHFISYARSHDQRLSRHL